MNRYVARRLLLFIPTLVVASLCVFGVMRALPGDITAATLGGQGEALDPELVAALRAELGLDDPIGLQYVRWAWSMVNGEFGGRSLESRQPIATILARQLPVTMHLTLYAAILAVCFSIPLGMLAALRRGRWPDRLVQALSVVGGALPGFWLALLVLLGLVYYARWSPPLIYAHWWQSPLEHFQLMAVPVLVLAWGFSADLTRVTRASMVEALQREHVRTAYAKGLSGASVLWRHALRTALLPVITVAGLHLGGLLGGAVILEYIFGIPGIGRGLVEAVGSRDYTVVQSYATLLITFALAVNLLIDVLYVRLDPRIRYDG